MLVQTRVLKNSAKIPFLPNQCLSVMANDECLILRSEEF